MPRASSSEIAERLSSTLDMWADADASDATILAGIKRLIAMQQGDTDSPSDSKVLAALKLALSAQEADMQES